MIGVAHADYAALHRLSPAVKELQRLAVQHGIDDIFQDNGGKVLEVCLILNLRLLPGRLGNDLVDEATGTEFELKTLNITKTESFTTHHHLNPAILEKYRKVEWLFAVYNGIELCSIRRMRPADLEPWFERWMEKFKAGVGRPLNNPKIPLAFVQRHGELVFDSAPSGVPYWFLEAIACSGNTALKD